LQTHNIYNFFILLFLICLILTSGCIKAGAKPIVPVIKTIVAVTATSTVTAERVLLLSPVSTYTPEFTVASTLENISLDHIPPAVYYDCPVGKTCTTSDTIVRDAIAQTIYNEGGLRFQLVVDILQVLDNTMHNAWDCWSVVPCSDEWTNLNPTHMPYKETSRDIRERLAIYILSRPYIVHNVKYPAWNGWSVPMQILTFEYEKVEYAAIQKTIETWLSHPETISLTPYYRHYTPANALIYNKGIMYFYVGFGKKEESIILPLEASAKYIYRFTISDTTYNIYYSIRGYSSP
jgi:hypothetical protein